MHLMKVVEDFIHLVGNALKAFQSSLIVTDNLGERRGGRGDLVWGEFGRKQTRQLGIQASKSHPGTRGDLRGHRSGR